MVWLVGDLGVSLILLIDNYDSFVQNLGRYFQRLGQDIFVVRNDQITVEQIRKMNPQAIVISPGPCTPDTAGISLEVIRELGREYPILGVCLGHQAIGQAYGGSVVLAKEPVHGRSSFIEHDGDGLFKEIDGAFQACRYHSLVVAEEGLPENLQKTAWLGDGTVMGIRHKEFPVVGIQFHPESVLTNNGFTILAQFLKLAGIEVDMVVPSVTDECRAGEAGPFETPNRPATF
ncbi:MAG: aminodeoxychorismate/anthranilate synthase component II [Planctomycetota bacterium]|nr:aminodeoxychorismate/anthranilate synthase component II [Planctomycetota bacterium]